MFVVTRCSAGCHFSNIYNLWNIFFFVLEDALILGAFVALFSIIPPLSSFMAKHTGETVPPMNAKIQFQPTLRQMKCSPFQTLLHVYSKAFSQYRLKPTSPELSNEEVLTHQRAVGFPLSWDRMISTCKEHLPPLFPVSEILGSTIIIVIVTHAPLHLIYYS